MKRKNYAFPLSFGVSVFLLAPLFAASYFLFIIFDIIEEENVPESILLTLVLFAITSLVITMIFYFSFKRMQLKYDDGVYHQGHLQVNENEIISIRSFKFFTVWALEIYGPDNTRLIDYFCDLKELNEFMNINNLLTEDNIEKNKNITLNSKSDDLWYLYSKGELNDEYFYLLDYYAGINGEGHYLFFSNNEDELDKINEELKKLLPETFYIYFHDALVSYINNKEDVSIKCDVADAYFYKHEQEILDMIEKHANELFNDNQTKEE